MKRLIYLLAFCAAFLPGGDGTLWASSANPFARAYPLASPQGWTPFDCGDAVASPRPEPTSAVATVEETVQMCVHQWIETDPNYVGGFIYNYTSPALTTDPVSITIRTESTNVGRWKWENLHPTKAMNGQPGEDPRPIANLQVSHEFWARTEPMVDKMLLRDFHSLPAYSDNGGSCTGHPLSAYDGTLDGAGTSGWDYLCPGDCVFTGSTASSKEKTYLWSSMSVAEQDKWRNGMLIGYRPQVNWMEFWGTTGPCQATNVTWETNHHWVNASDFRCSVKIIFRANY